MVAPKYEPGDSIPSGTLYRRIFPREAYFKDGRPTSLVFLPESGESGVSAHLAELTSPEAVLANHADYGLAEITVEAVIQAGLDVIFDPREGQPGHVKIVGEIKRSKARELSRSRACTVRIPPTIP